MAMRLIASVVLYAAAAASAHTSLRVLWPPPNYLVATPNVPIAIAVTGPTTDGHIRLTGHKLRTTFAMQAPGAVIGNIYLGSHHVLVEALSANFTRISAPIVLYIERIPSRVELFRDSGRSKMALVALPAAKAARPTTRTLCFGGASSPMDGQKRLWLRLLASLRRHPTVDYSFHVFLLEPKPVHPTDVFTAHGWNVTYVPMMVLRKDIARYDITHEKMMAALADFGQADDRTTFPSYVHSLWASLAEAFAPCKGGVLSYPNSASDVDRVWAAVGRAVGAAGVVLELSGVMPMPHSVDLLVGPSQYTVDHPSVSQVMRAGIRTVIPPGVDHAIFASRARSPNPCVVVGYLGRIVAEKSLGLLARAVELLLQTNMTASCVTFRWVGDGGDAKYYKRYPITLLGSIDDEAALVHELQTWDMAVQPGLQETFCIANLEVMAMGLPLVTFGVAGVAEYVRHMENAWVVDEISPPALASAIALLVDDPTLRRRLGHGARRTIETRYTWAHTVAAYDEAYGRLIGHATYKP
ncbi:hypothetical protein SDRG_02595 [Saprolegnia diclina VS20]|uniref:Uncharacterized protein n=1 Tax=Saprolegnia diclina (strain VS20) TaxID=1156394 RepID=T0QPB4_SAPDV|nr:hypothetical protein SDRG_02595 [Saprolegnia diclina VS20]EQC39939.1 hypothetical protein SDRG_02595 [Saprolegnia diclina VS20]|eukprot:XP_008606413.1 hypothetical protein SDRG_02595 [Saprolegnia diclina VS20]